MIASGRMADVFVEVADTLVADFDVIDFLHNLTEHAAAVSGAGAVGILLADQEGSLQFMAASNPTGERLERVQLESGEGPCLDCFHSREPVVNADLASAEGRWPVFASHAVSAGFRSVHAFPMRLRDQAIGALNLFGSADTIFEPDDVGVVQALADIATIAILQERGISRAEILTEQLQAALNSRILIEQAKGAVAQLVNISVDEAFALLRQRARSRGERLQVVAQEVLSGSAESF